MEKKNFGFVGLMHKVEMKVTRKIRTIFASLGVYGGNTRGKRGRDMKENTLE